MSVSLTKITLALEYTLTSIFIFDKDGYSSRSDGDDDPEDTRDHYDFGGAGRYSGDESERDSFISTEKSQRKRSSKHRRHQDTRTEPTRGVLTEQAARNHQERRKETARNMAGSKRKTPAENKALRKKRQEDLKAKSKAKRRKTDQDEEESVASGDENENAPLKAMLKRQQDQLDKLSAENSRLKSKKTKPGSIITARIPFTSALQQAVTKYVENNIWREVKFLANDMELLAVCAAVMENIPEFHDLVQDPVNKDENVQAFRTVYGAKFICKAINEKRTNAQSGMKKAFEKRHNSGHAMPTPAQLKTVIARNLKSMEEVSEVPAHSESLTDEERLEIRAKGQENAQNRAWFQWYWSCLLPAVAGKLNWGYTIRNFMTITGGVHPDDTSKKFVTSSDEALVLAIYENCGQRFPYTAQCKLDNVPVDFAHANYPSKWTDNAAGQCEWGGWNKAGRKRYRDLRKSIAGKKRQPHVLALERRLLRRFRRKLASKPVVPRKRTAMSRILRAKRKRMHPFLAWIRTMRRMMAEVTLRTWMISISLLAVMRRKRRKKTKKRWKVRRKRWKVRRKTTRSSPEFRPVLPRHLAGLCPGIRPNVWF